MTDFGPKFRAAREAAHLSRDAVSAEAGVARSTLQLIESGASDPSEPLTRLMRALGGDVRIVWPERAAWLLPTPYCSGNRLERDNYRELERIGARAALDELAAAIVERLSLEGPGAGYRSAASWRALAAARRRGPT